MCGRDDDDVARIGEDDTVQIGSGGLSRRKANGGGARWEGISEDRRQIAPFPHIGHDFGAPGRGFSDETVHPFVGVELRGGGSAEVGDPEGGVFQMRRRVETKHAGGERIMESGFSQGEGKVISNGRRLVVLPPLRRDRGSERIPVTGRSIDRGHDGVVLLVPLLLLLLLLDDLLGDGHEIATVGAHVGHLLRRGFSAALELLLCKSSGTRSPKPGGAH